MRECASVSADWSILDEEGVVEIAESAARKVARKYQAADVEDLLQQAYIILATKTAEMRAALEGGKSHLFRVLWQDLTNLAKVQQDKANRNKALDEATQPRVTREDWLDIVDMERQVKRAAEYSFPVTVRRVGE